MVKNWQKLESEIKGHFRIFTIRQDQSRSPRTGNTHNFFILEAKDWVNIIPITSEGKVVMIHQYRHGIEAVTLEIPGGEADPEDSSPAAAAERELLEETGYAVEVVIPIGKVTPNPAFLDNHCHTFLALGAKKVTTPQFDGSEDIAVQEIDLADIPSLVQNGRITHALVIAAFYHLDHYRQQNPTHWNLIP